MEDFVGITKPINNVSQAIPNIDYKYGPYNSLNDAKSSLPMKVRSVGLTIGVRDGVNIIEYWFNGGVSNDNLIFKQTGAPGPSGDVYVPQFDYNVFDI